MCAPNSCFRRWGVALLSRERQLNGQWQRAQVQQTRGLNLTHNHHLKAIFKGAATTVIAQHPDEPLNAA